MLAAIRSEFRKLLTVRSTYAISGIAILLTGFIAFYGMGFHSWPGDQPPTQLQDQVMNIISIYQIFAAIVAILLIAHEYRYNTIMYTLTISNRRLKVLFAKMLVITIYGAVITLIALGTAFPEIMLGVKASGHHLGVQHVALLSVIWRSLVFTISGALTGLVFGFLSRSVVFAIVAFFVLPTTIEPLLHGLLNISNNYLPFASQSQILTTGPGTNSPLASAGVFLAYLAGAWIIATVLFMRRDAN
jgi:ABC-2 type transport system permease protein